MEATERIYILNKINIFLQVRVLSASNWDVLLSFLLDDLEYWWSQKPIRGKLGSLEMTPWGHMGNVGSFVIYDKFYRI